MAKNVSSSSSVSTSTSGLSVKKVNILNKLFLDLDGLSKNMQALLRKIEVMVVAQVKSISEHSTSEKMGLKNGETYYKCQVEKVEHIFNFTSVLLNKQTDDGLVDYSFTDYVCK
jgi:hypothetical protein